MGLVPYCYYKSMGSDSIDLQLYQGLVPLLKRQILKTIQEVNDELS